MFDKYAQPVLLAYQLTCASGNDIQSLTTALRTQASGLKPNTFPGSNLPTWIGQVDPVDDYSLPEDQGHWESRNNRLIHFALQQGTFQASLDQLKNVVSASRIGVVMGSSTSSIDRSETAYRDLTSEGALKAPYQQQDVLNPHAPGLYTAFCCGVTGPSITVNTACSSSAKVFASAQRWLSLGIVDAVIVGGADTLCLSVLEGFNALQLVSSNPCKPFDATRDGINLGEAAGFAILVKDGLFADHSGVRFIGAGESSDAHHMSHPHPEGSGAKLAIEQALKMANLKPQHIDYINLHGTASRANDSIEGKLIADMFPTQTAVSSTKGWTGHTLGAAGIVESLIAIESLRHQFVPGTMNLEQMDPEIALDMDAKNQTRSLKHVMSNSFGFGGNNVSVIFGQA